MAHKKNTAITPPGSPAMDRPSIAFAWFLDSMVIMEVDRETSYMVCNLCGDNLCSIEDGDTLRILLNTALAHTC